MGAAASVDAPTRELLRKHDASALRVVLSSRARAQSLPVSHLKKMLQLSGISHAHCVEKAELVQLVNNSSHAILQRLVGIQREIGDRSPAKASAGRGGSLSAQFAQPASRLVPRS